MSTSKASNQLFYDMNTSKESLQSVFNGVYSVFSATRGMYFFEKELRAMCNRNIQRKVDILIRNRVYLDTYDPSLFSFSEMMDHIDGDIFYDKGQCLRKYT